MFKFLSKYKQEIGKYYFSSKWKRPSQNNVTDTELISFVYKTELSHVEHWWL